VQNLRQTATGVRHILLLALLGIGVVFLSGPIIAVAGVVLSVVVGIALIVLTFAFIGFVVWAPLYVAVAGKEVAWQKVRGMARLIRDTLGHLGHIGVQSVALPARFVAGVFKRSLHVARVGGGFLAEVGVMALTGAGLGAGLGVILATVQHQDYAQMVPLNAVAGAGIAALSGTVMALLSRRSRRPLAA
jgi:hypothetical protein